MKSELEMKYVVLCRVSDVYSSMITGVDGMPSSVSSPLVVSNDGCLSPAVLLDRPDTLREIFNDVFEESWVEDCIVLEEKLLLNWVLNVSEVRVVTQFESL